MGSLPRQRVLCGKTFILVVTEVNLAPRFTLDWTALSLSLSSALQIQGFGLTMSVIVELCVNPLAGSPLVQIVTKITL